MLTTVITASLEQAVAKYQTAISLASDYLGSRGIGPRVAEAARLGVVAEPEPGDEHMQGRLAIPYLTRAGVVAVKYRCIQDHSCKEASHPKYTGHSNKRPRMYNANAFFQHSSVIGITEGEFDALVLSHYVGIPAVGCPGVSTWQSHFPRCFSGYDQVLMFADGDKPGRDMARMIQKELMQTRVVYMPDDQDVNDVYLTEGADGLRKRAGL